MIHSVTKEYVDELKLILDLLKKVGIIPIDFIFSTVQVLFNAKVKPHIDQNANDSITFTCGDHQGGELVVEEEFINVFRSPLRFSGDRMHYVAPFTGSRISVVLYPHQRFAELPPDDLRFLRSVGFQLPMEVSPKAGSVKPASGDVAPQPWALLEVNVPLNGPALCFREKEMESPHFYFDMDPESVAVARRLCPGAWFADNGTCADSPEVAEFFTSIADYRCFIAAEIRAGPDFELSLSKISFG